MIAPIPLARQAARRLLRAPAFAIAAALTLALGIGATTAVFGVVESVLLRPLPYHDPSRLVDLSHTLEISGIARVDQSDATFLYYRRANHVFSEIGAYAPTSATVGGREGARDDAPAERVTAARASASTFRVLGAAPSRGRTFAESEDRPDAPPVVLLGHGLWERKYGGDPAIVGRRIRVDGVEREVVGIMPARFGFPGDGTQLWLPLGIDPARTRSAAFDYRGVARLREGATIESAARDLRRLLPRVPEAFPGRLTASAIEQTHMRAVVRPLRDVVVGDVGRVLWVILGAVACVLLVACANVANLFLVRADARQREIAVRRALGAGRRALVAEMLAEGCVLAAIGGTLGLVLAAVGVRALRAMDAARNIPRLSEVGVDALTLAVAAAVSVLAALLVSAVPALRATALTPASVLAEGGRTGTGGRQRHRARQLLIVSQVALALVLLVGAGLMARSFVRLRAVQPGFETAHALTFRVALPEATYAASGAPTRFLLRALDQIGAVPGVRDAGVVTKLPLDATARRDTALFVEDRPPTAGTMPNLHQVAFASPGYFRALGIPLVEGRTFERPDPAKAPLEVVVSRALAARYWSGGASPIGRRVRMAPDGPWFTIVGVAGDVRGTALEEPPDETIYLPLVVAPGDAGSDARWTPRDVAFVVRDAGDPSRIAPAAERIVRTIDPSVPVYAMRAMDDVVSGAGARTSFTLALLAIASAAALALGAVGIYGVVSYVVGLRAREIAVRLALGARPSDVRRMVSGQALIVAAIGIVTGVAGAAAVTRVMAALLFGVSPSDPATIAAAALLLLAVAAAASWLPAHRASRVDPARALRAE